MTCPGSRSLPGSEEGYRLLVTLGGTAEKRVMRPPLRATKTTWAINGSVDVTRMYPPDNPLASGTRENTSSSSRFPGESIRLDSPTGGETNLYRIAKDHVADHSVPVGRQKNFDRITFNPTLGLHRGQLHLAWTGGRVDQVYVGKDIRCGAPGLRSLLRLKEGAVLKVLEGFPELLPGIHHDGAGPGDGLAERTAGNEQESDARLPGLH